MFLRHVERSSTSTYPSTRHCRRLCRQNQSIASPTFSSARSCNESPSMSSRRVSHQKGHAHELFSPVSIAYPDVRKTVIDYVIKNWEEVQASESWVEMSEKAMAGEIEGAAQISFALLKELHAKGLIRTTLAEST